jgi:hypothetical protein
VPLNANPLPLSETLCAQRCAARWISSSDTSRIFRQLQKATDDISALGPYHCSDTGRKLVRSWQNKRRMSNTSDSSANSRCLGINKSVCR